MRHRRRDEGRCPYCGGELEPGFKKCSICREKHRKYQADHPAPKELTAKNQKAMRDRRRAAGLCPDCGAERDGPTLRCEKCRKEKNESTRRHRHLHDRDNEDRRMRRRFGMSLEEYEEMSSHQDGKCLVCGGVNSDGAKLAIDHCHVSGRIRGLLCRKCNVALGLLGENPDTIQKLKEYLETY